MNSLKQKLLDLITLLKKNRMTQVFAVLAVFLLGALLFGNNTSQRTMIKKQEAKKLGAGASGGKEAYSDLIGSFKAEQEKLKSLAQQNQAELVEVRQKNKEYEERTAEIFKRILERMAETESTVINSGGAAAGGQIDIGSMPSSAGMGNAAAATGQGGGYNPAAAASANGSFSAANLATSVPPGFAPGSSSGAAAQRALSEGGVMQADGSVRTISGEVIRPTDMNEPDELESLGSEESIVAPPPSPQKQRLAVVGAGDSVRIKLLAGVNAPTDGTPYPVVFKLISDVYGPDGSSLPLGEARLIAAAQGSLSDSRALFRLSSLNLSLPDGRRKIIPVDGWVVGEDGIRGMEGVTIDPIGKAIGGAVIVGGLDGLGKAFADQQVTRTTNMFGGVQEMVTGNDMVFAGGKALSAGSKQWGRIIEERMQLLVPHVEVLSGREATAVFSRSFIIKDLYNSLADDNSSFGSLD